jgi:hypothetical protein
MNSSDKTYLVEILVSKVRRLAVTEVVPGRPEKTALTKGHGRKDSAGSLQLARNAANLLLSTREAGRANAPALVRGWQKGGATQSSQLTAPALGAHTHSKGDLDGPKLNGNDSHQTDNGN